ncbi:MAG: ATP synthase subunit delta [bacterium ADurb.Bin400]|nr:MAG: ATP synthase subunit delta [bacterium ADurb.Bin400]
MASEIENYTQEILALIYKKEDFDQLLFDVSVFADLIGYESVAKNAGEDVQQRKNYIKLQLDRISSDILKNYLEGLLSQDDLQLFEPGLFKLFVEELNEAASKTLFFKLTTAIEIEPEDLNQMSAALSKKMERKVIIDITVDKSIVGGAIIKKENYIFDFSIKTKLGKLSSDWKRSIQKAKNAND